MFASFVIGLREGLEAALIIGIVSAFLGRSGRRRERIWMWVGVGSAVTLCAAVAIGLNIASAELPERGQEILEATISLIAVAFVTWMILWMRKHSRTLRHELEADAAAALATGSAAALVLMAFLAVLREGFETAVFLLTRFQESSRPLATGMGALIGVGVALLMGVAVARGGLRIDLARFFKVTGFLLVLIAAGLLAFAVHAFQELGWIPGTGARTLDFAWLAADGTLRGAIVTGLFGVRARPSAGEVAVWLTYAIPMGILVLRPSGGRTARPRAAIPAV